MQPPVEQRVRDQRAEDVRRLADQGARNNVHILVTRDGSHIATSASDPTRAYVVTPAGCQRKGWAFWGRCQHWALLLSELGLIPDAGADEVAVLPWGDLDPDPAPEPAIRPLARQYVYHAA